MTNIMADRTRSAFAAGDSPWDDQAAAPPAVSWQAVAAGGLAATAVTLLLLALGAGVGLASVSPWPSAGVAAGAFATMTAVWLIAVQWISAGFGGYLAGRLRNESAGVHTHEAFFRDTAHGFLAWALAAVIGVAALASVTGSLAAGGAQIAGAAASGIAKAAGGAAAPDGLIDKLFRPATPAPAGAEDAASRAEAARIVAGAIGSGTLADDDKTYLAAMVAARTGVPAPEAAKRIDEAMAQAKAAAAKLRAAADEARKAAETLSFYVFFSMLIGAFISCVAAAIGGSQRTQAAGAQ